MVDKHKPGFRLSEGDGSGAGSPPKRKTPKLIWILAILVIGLVTYGYYSGGI